MSETGKQAERSVSKPKKSTARDSKKETVMYIGPNIPGRAIKGTLYQNAKLPELLKEKLEEMPVLKSLFVPVSDLARSMKELRNPKSAISTCYANALAEINKGGVEDEHN